MINTHKEVIDAALCEHCGWRSDNNRQLHFHMQMEHKVKTNLYTFPECLVCGETFLDTNALNQHMKDQHVDDNEKQQCIYCNKIFAKEMQLYNHMKTYHKKQAIEDGIIDYTEEELMGVLADHELLDSQPNANNKKESQIKILSDISLPSVSTLPGIKSGSSQQIQVESFSLTEPKFVNADGNEMILTKEQRKEILSQLNQEQDNSRVVMICNDSSEQQQMEQECMEQEQIEEQQESQAETEQDDEDEFDENHIYKELTKKRELAKQQQQQEEQQQQQTDESSADGNNSADLKKLLDESKESAENLEWAENLISAHEMEDEQQHQAEPDKVGCFYDFYLLY